VFHSVRRAKRVAILHRNPRTAQQGANFRKDPLTKLLEIHMRLVSFTLHARRTRCALTIVGAAVCCTLSACMTAKIEEVRQAPTQITSNEAIVLLAKPHLEGAATEDQFLDCLEEHLVGSMVSARAADRQRAGKKVDARSNLSKSPFQIYADAQFIDALYPWLEPSTAPANAQAFSSFLGRPGVTERVTEMGVRYVVWVDGTTQKTDGGGSIACAAGPGGAGCLGLGWWQKTSDYEATIWDLRSGTSVGTLSTDVKGTSFMIGAIAPIPLVAPVQSTACNRLAGQLKSFLVGSEEDDSTPRARPQ
jgi:hypothetical protein